MAKLRKIYMFWFHGGHIEGAPGQHARISTTNRESADTRRLINILLL